MSSTRPELRPPRGMVVAAFAAIYLFWGGTFLAIRYAVEVVPPLLVIAIRCLGGAAILGLWAARQPSPERLTARHWVLAAISGVLLFVGCHGVLAWAELRVPSGQAAVIMTTISLWLVLLDALRSRQMPQVATIVGALIALAGVALLAWSPADAGRTASLGLTAALLFSSFSWAAGSLFARGAIPGPLVRTTAMQLATGGVATLLLSGLTGELTTWSPASITLRGALSLAFLVLLGTVVGMAAYNWLLAVSTPAKVGTCSFVNPVVALMLGWLLAGEPLTGRTLAAAALVIAAVVLVMWTPAPAKPVEAPALGAVRS